MADTLTNATADLLARLLCRLPQSLWDTDPTSPTVQRDLYRAQAVQLAVFLEQRDIARRMTLLRSAEGIDLDRLLADYGLKRYLQRPDAAARQIGQNLLFAPRGTHYAIERLADLLFDLPHATLRTGRGQTHVFVAAVHPVTTPHSYWGLISAAGLWYAVSVDRTVPTISQGPPPGLNVAPGPHTLTWFTVQDGAGVPWYVSIAEETLRLDPVPPAGYGTTEPFAVLDGRGNRWRLEAQGARLVSVLDTGLAGFGTWRVTDRLGTLWFLAMERQVPTLTSAAPVGSLDQTPGGIPLDWFTVEDALGTPWYVSIEAETLAVTSTSPGGLGTASLAEFLDQRGQRWVLSTRSGVLVTQAVNPHNADFVVVAPAAPFQALKLVDSAGGPWWVCLDKDTFLTTELLPVGARDATPAGGPYHWWRFYDVAHTPWYVWPSTSGVLLYDTVSPGGAGTRAPEQLGDAHGVLWHGAVRAGTLLLSDAPPVDDTGLPTALCLRDEAGAAWFWRVSKQVLEWSPVLWPDTIDQSPWGEIGWLQVSSSTGEPRFLFPTRQGDATAAAVPPASSPWGWNAPVRLRDASGIPWALSVRGQATVRLDPERPDELPLAPGAIPVAEALEAFRHVQAAGSLLTLLIS